MLTNNYYALELNSLWSHLRYTATSNIDSCYTDFEIFDTTGVRRTKVSSNVTSCYGSHRGWRGAMWNQNEDQTTRLDNGFINIICGAGSTPATAQDYKLEDQLVSQLAYVSHGCSCEKDAGTVTVIKTFRNVSQEPVTVRELGLITHHYTGSSHFNVLVIREVLENPITVAPGGTFTVPMTFHI